MTICYEEIRQRFTDILNGREGISSNDVIADILASTCVLISSAKEEIDDSGLVTTTFDQEGNPKKFVNAAGKVLIDATETFRKSYSTFINKSGEVVPEQPSEEVVGELKKLNDILKGLVK